MAKSRSTTLGEYGLHWFRRDLRIAGNPSLHWSRNRYQGRVLGIFCIDSRFLSRPDFSASRFAFFLETLKELQSEMRETGSDLLVLDLEPEKAFEMIFETLKNFGVPLPESCSYNRDYEPYAIKRDERINRLLTEEWGRQVHSERDHLLIEPNEIYKKDKPRDFYQIYSPYARRWFERLKTDEIKERISSQSLGLQYLRERALGRKVPKYFQMTWGDLFRNHPAPTDSLEKWIKKNRAHVHIPIPKAGSLAAYEKLVRFRDHLQQYHLRRDFPGVEGTSRLSLYLKNGSLTASQIMAELGLGRERFKGTNGATVYLKEIAWREFYYQILYHCPWVEEGAFLKKFRTLSWDNNEALFQAWCEGRTGYPIIDAGMRELNETGWMHNRVRMIVASFLTKDLLVDWRWGERYFMKHLLDGDLAANNGGWQWAASTGCDPQPYFRIFNPVLQSKKFDPHGEYIRKYIPQFKNLKDSQIHIPKNPIVDHSSQKIKALRLYSAIK